MGERKARGRLNYMEEYRNFLAQDRGYAIINSNHSHRVRGFENGNTSDILRIGDRQI